MKTTASLAAFAAVSILGAGALAPAAVSAQAEPQPQTTPPAATTPESPGAHESAAQVSDEKIEQFASAFAEIQGIQSQATRELESATDEAQADRVVTNAETQMIAAVERSGLQIDEFNRIAELMTTDVGVRARVAEKLQQQRGG